MMHYFDSPFVFVDDVKNSERVKSMVLETIDSHIQNNLCYSADDQGGSITNYFKEENFTLDSYCEERIIWQPIKNMINQLKEDRDLPVIPSKAELKTMWFIKYIPNSYVTPHVHFNADISGIFVVKNEDQDISTSFKQEGNVGSWMYSEMIYNSNVKEGQVVLFPSHLTHWVNPVKNTRIIVAFDITLKP